MDKSGACLTDDSLLAVGSAPSMIIRKTIRDRKRMYRELLHMAHFMQNSKCSGSRLWTTCIVDGKFDQFFVFVQVSRLVARTLSYLPVPCKCALTNNLDPGPPSLAGGLRLTDSLPVPLAGF